MRRNNGTRLRELVLLVGVLCAATALCAPPARAAQNSSPAPAPSKRDAERRALYQTFRDNFRGGPAEQKVAFEAAKKYLKKYGKDEDPTNVPVVDYLRRWKAKYEQAVAAYEGWKKNGMGLGPGQPPNTGGGAAVGLPAQQAGELIARHIRGRVVNAQGLAVPEAEVCARPANSIRGALPCAVADGEGNFSIRIEASERYYLTARKESDGYANSYHVFYRVPFAEPPQIAMYDERDASGVIVNIGSQAGRHGVAVTDAETGLPVTTPRLRLCRVETPRYCSAFDLKLRDGRHSLLVPPVPLTLEVSAPGYEDWNGAGDVPESLHVAPGASRELNVTLKKERDGAPPPPRALAAPKLLSPADGAVFDHYPRTTVLEWAAVPGAAGYEVEIEFFHPCTEYEGCRKSAPHQLAGDPPTHGLEATRYEFNFVGAQQGRWRVRALGARGRVGAKSGWFNFVYKR